MQRSANPLLRHVICRGCFDTASERQCPQYLRALRTLHLSGFNTIFLGQTDIPESLISGEKIAEEASLCWLVWTLIHTGSCQGWVPWRYKLQLRGELPIHQQNGVFQELCQSLSTSYGKCIIVTRDKTLLMRGGAKDGKSQRRELCCQYHQWSTSPALSAAPNLLEPMARSFLLCLHLTSISILWMSPGLLWNGLLIINNRKDFALRSIERTHSYRCILFSDMIVKGIEKMTPNKWKVAINRVKRWENYCLDTLS